MDIVFKTYEMKKLIVFMFSLVLLASCDKEVEDIEGCTDLRFENLSSYPQY